MSLVTQIAALATRVAAEVKLLRTEIPPDLPAYTPAGDAIPMLTTNGSVASWTTTPVFAYLGSLDDAIISGMTIGKGGGASPVNLAFGAGALASNTTGFGLCAVGADALYSNTDGSYNVAFGYSALGSLAAGSDNTVFGTLAGSALSGGNSNTLVGRSAGQNISTGSSNTIIGRYSGTASLTGTIVLAAGVTARAWCDSSGKWGFGTTAPTAAGDFAGDSLRVRIASTPVSADAAGDAGTLKWDATAIHFCVSQGTWKSLPFSAFGATTPGASGPSGIPIYVQETEPAAPAIWYKTDADGAVIDILRVT